MKITAFLSALVLYALLASVAVGQTISPTAEEYKGPHVKGLFVLQNPGLRPISVTVDGARGFTVANGQPVATPLDPGVVIVVKKPSFVIGPRNTHTVSFEARCATLPCRFILMSNFTSAAKGDGLRVAVHLGEVVYVCAKQRNCRKTTLAALGVGR